MRIEWSPTRIDVLLSMRVFRRPKLWLSVWLLMIIAVIVLSLMSKPPIPRELMIGKLDHLIAYIALAAMAVQLFRDREIQVSAGLTMIALGIALELAQGYVVDGRVMSMYDVFVDAIGVCIGLATTWLPLAKAVQRLDMRVRYMRARGKR